MFRRLYVQIQALYTGLTFLRYFWCQNCNVCLKDENKQKRGHPWPLFFKKNIGLLDTTRYVLTFKLLSHRNYKT